MTAGDVKDISIGFKYEKLTSFGRLHVLWGVFLLLCYLSAKAVFLFECSATEESLNLEVNYVKSALTSTMNDEGGADGLKKRDSISFQLDREEKMEEIKRKCRVSSGRATTDRRAYSSSPFSFLEFFFFTVTCTDILKSIQRWCDEMARQQ